MIYEFRFPDIGEGVAEGELIKWHVKPGDEVEEEQLVADVLTDKVTIEITSPVSGRVKDVFASEGDLIKVGSVIITFNTNNSPSENNESSNRQSVPAQGSEEVPTEQKQNGNKRIVLAVPTVRRLARELNADLSVIEGTGKNGRVTEEDVRGFVADDKPLNHDKPATKTSADVVSFVEAEERIPLRGIRRTIAQSMQKSVNTAAHCSILEEIDITELVKLRKQINESNQNSGVRFTYLPFIIKSVINALKKFPKFNASIDDDKEEIILKKYYNIGIAADTPAGLIVPVIKNADKKSMTQLAAEIADLADKARHQKLKMDDLKGSTFTISNIGSTGIGTFATPVINLPEVAILGINRIQKKTVVKNDTDIVIRDMMGLGLTMDHRLVDGAEGAYFLKEMIQYLEQPYLLLMEMV